MGSQVTFEFVQINFLDRNFEKLEANYAYRISDGYGEAFDCRKSKEELAAITPDIALKLIEENHGEFYEVVLGKGFQFHQDWIEVDKEGNLKSQPSNQDRDTLDVSITDEEGEYDVEVYDMIGEDNKPGDRREDLSKVGFSTRSDAEAYIISLEGEYDIRFMHDGKYQYYKSLMQNGDMVIHFFGEIGTYWKEGKIHLDVTDLTPEQKDAEVLSVIQANRVA